MYTLVRFIPVQNHKMFDVQCTCMLPVRLFICVGLPPIKLTRTFVLVRTELRITIKAAFDNRVGLSLNFWCRP